MRTSIGFGLVALFLGSSLAGIACGDPDVIYVHKKKSSTDDTTTDDGTSGDGTSSDGTGSSSQPGAADDSNPDKPASPVVNGLTISEVAVFQAVKVDVMKAGKLVAPSSRNAPVVAGRPALVRVYVTPSSGWSAQSVTAELRLVSGTTKAPIVSDTKTISAASTDANTNSTFNIEVPADSIADDSTFQITLTASSNTSTPSGNSDGRFPQDGSATQLGAKKSGVVKVVVVPVKYMADGSGRTPDVSATQLQRYKDMLMSIYPATDIQVTARAAWQYSGEIDGNGNGFDDVLNAVTQLRKTDKAASDTYYYGALAPASSFNSFCSGGCVAGLGNLVSDNSPAYMRAVVGIGFSGEDAAGTMAHEIGHAHGREHAPCGGAGDPDPQFPYSGGGIGSWGYDIVNKTFKNPSKATDLMGYCENTWISDYNYKALFERVAEVNGNSANLVAQNGGGGAPSSHTYRVARVDKNGVAHWTDEVELDAEAQGGEARTATFADIAGTTLGSHTARFYPYDHMAGGLLFVPTTFAPVSKTLGSSAWSQVRIAGVTAALAR